MGREEKPTRAKRGESTTKRHQTNQTKTHNRPRRTDITEPANTPDNKAGRRNPTTKVQRGEQAEASKQGRSRRPGRQQRQEGASSTSQEDGHVQLYRCPKGILDHPRANTSVPERGAHEQHPPHGGEGKAPHRAEAFVAMRRSEDRSRSPTTRHARGMATGPLQIQPDIRREGPVNNRLDQKTPEDNQGGKGGGNKEEAGQTASTHAKRGSNNKKATPPRQPEKQQRKREPRSTK